MLDQATIDAVAKRLYDARKSRDAVRHVSREHPGMTIDDGYAIQRAWVKLELADGSGDHAFCWFNLRVARGRSAATHKACGDALVAAAREHFAPVLARRAVGLTLQIDEGPEVFDGKFGNLHAHFAARASGAER